MSTSGVAAFAIPSRLNVKDPVIFVHMYSQELLGKYEKDNTHIKSSLGDVTAPKVPY